MASDGIYVLASFTPREGSEERLRGLLEDMTDKVRAEPGCQRYDVYGQEGSTDVHLIEVYDDRAALEAHRESAHYKDYRSVVIDLLAAPIAVRVLHPINTA